MIYRRGGEDGILPDDPGRARPIVLLSESGVEEAHLTERRRPSLSSGQRCCWRRVNVTRPGACVDRVGVAWSVVAINEAPPGLERRRSNKDDEDGKGERQQRHQDQGAQRRRCEGQEGTNARRSPSHHDSNSYSYQGIHATVIARRRCLVDDILQSVSWRLTPNTTALGAALPFMIHHTRKEINSPIHWPAWPATTISPPPAFLLTLLTTSPSSFTPIPPCLRLTYS